MDRTGHHLSAVAQLNSAPARTATNSSAATQVRRPEVAQSIYVY